MGFHHFVQTLAEARANVNKQDDYSETALVSASLLTGNCSEGYDKCIPPFIQAGADGNIANHGG